VEVRAYTGGAKQMKYLKQVAGPVGAFLAVTLLITVLAAPYLREAERQSAHSPQAGMSHTARVQ